MINQHSLKGNSIAQLFHDILHARIALAIGNHFNKILQI